MKKKKKKGAGKWHPREKKGQDVPCLGDWRCLNKKIIWSLSSAPAVVLRFLRLSSGLDERGSKALQAPLHVGTGREVDAVKKLELLRAEFIISLAVLPVEGLCRCEQRGGTFRKSRVKFMNVCQRISSFAARLSFKRAGGVRSLVDFLPTVHSPTSMLSRPKATSDRNSISL